MTETTKTKKQLIIFLLVAYGVTYLMGLLAWYGNTKAYDLSVFPTAQMYYPAAGVMLAYLVTEWKDSLLPKWFYICFVLVAAVMMLMSVLAVVQPEQMEMMNGQAVSFWALVSQYAAIGGSILSWIALFISRKNRRAAYGLGWKNGIASIGCITVFLILYFGRVFITYALAGDAGMMLDIFKNPGAFSYLMTLPINFIITFTAFFGEEYGWRYYLQPLMQKRFGMRSGVILLGLAWGVWHIFLDFFFYTTPDRGIVMTVSQIITCVTLGIFMAWTYLKTNNIWVPVIIHFLNNNLVLLIANNYSLEALENQQVTWEMIPSSLLVNGILFGLFLISREFGRKEQDYAVNDCIEKSTGQKIVNSGRI